MKKIAALTLLVSLFVSCKEKQKEVEQIKEDERTPVAYSLSGDPFYEPDRSTASLDRLEANLEEAKQNLISDSSEINFIWYGRRLAYLSRYPEAVQVFTDGIGLYPSSYRLYRHRGHRFISMREFEKAIKDLSKAAKLMPKDTIEIEPDGIPNKLNQPLSSTQFNVWYHLALAYYLNGDFQMADDIYQECMATSVNNDLLVATSDWWYMTLKRLGNESQADSLLNTIPLEMEIIENDSYFKRLQMYKGNMSPDSVLSVDKSSSDFQLSLATQGYGVGNYYLMNGDTLKSKEIFDQVLSGDYWSAFGYIASEAEKERMKRIQKR